MHLEALREALYKSEIENVLDELAKSSSVSVLDYLQNEADLTTDKNYRKRCIQCLCEAAKRYQTLPPTLFLRNIEKEQSSWPLRGGGFADIWKGRSTSDGTPLCLKVLRMFAESEEVRRKKTVLEFCREALVWRQLDHPNVLPFLGVNTDLFAPGFCLVLPWMENGDILKYMKQHPTHDLPKSLREIAAGIAYLHSHEPTIVHGDIRGANILVTDDLTCALADFGLAIATESRIMPTSSGSGLKGSIRCFSPSNHPSQAKRKLSVILAVVSRSRPKRPRDSGWCTDELWDLVERCWAHEPHMRPKADDVLRELEGILTSLRTSSFEPPSTHAPSLVTSLTPKHPMHDSLELVPPSLEETELPTWARHDRDLFSDLLEPYDAPISPVPFFPFYLQYHYLPFPRATVTTAPSTPKREVVLKLEELWSTPTRTKRSGKVTGAAEAKEGIGKTLGSNILNLSPRKRPISRSSSIGGGSDSDENNHPGSGSDSRMGTSTPTPMCTRAQARARRRIESKNGGGNEDAGRMERIGTGGTGGSGKTRVRPEATKARGTRKLEVPKGRLGQGRTTLSVLPPPVILDELACYLEG
ncbi:hypothetical protein AAF712_014304 [Marasmius tenuissimus]|uniref:Protein kinase domain-containing protein n=1 Tax=Marasmius tenuissimus TaxID=585030 RepID=A0ABR2ZDB9_9AGAR